jgi:hypothetical protein
MGKESSSKWAIKGSITVYIGHSKKNLHLKENMID